MSITIKRTEFSTVEYKQGGEVKGATATFPRDLEAVRQLKHAFPKIFWSRRGGGWYLVGKTAARRLERWADEHLPTGDAYDGDKMHDEETIEPLELPHGSQYAKAARVYSILTPYDEELVETIKGIPRAAWHAKKRRWEVPVTSRRELAAALPTIRARMKAVGKALREQKETRKMQRRRDEEAQRPRKDAVDTKDHEVIRLRAGSGYGGRGWKAGQVIRNSDRRVEAGEPRYLLVVRAGSQYYREDGMSFGVGDESGYVYWAEAREATGDEAAALRERDDAESARRDALLAVDTLRQRVQDEGGRPMGEGEDTRVVPEGEILLDSTDAYGGGDWWVVSPDAIWYCRNNGADGDDWSLNNVRTGGAGAIGWRIQHDREAEELLRRVVDLSEPK